MLRKFIGDRAFYKKVLSLSVPIMVQNGITNFVNMLDNIMVGKVGTEQMSGVALANQLFFVFMLCVFGCVSGAGIFVAQFYGKKDHEGVRDTFRFKFVSTLIIAAAGIAVFALFGEQLMRLYLSGECTPEEAALTIEYGKRYIAVMLPGLLPYAVVQCYSGTLRETGSPVPPMTAGVIAVLVNLVLNYILIFGKLGAPALGVTGAAIATLVSRIAELAFVVIWTHRHKQKNVFIVGAFRSLRVPSALTKSILKRGMPLLVNETMWAMSIAVMNQCYSYRSYDAISANNICVTYFSVFSVAFMSVGAAIGILLGQRLGVSQFEEAKEDFYKLAGVSVFTSLIFGGLYFASSYVVPEFYNTTESIKSLAASLMRICAIAMPFDAFANAAYFTLRSGGKTFITFLFDSGFAWAVNVPTAFILSRFTGMPLLVLYAVCQSELLIKDVLGTIYVKKGIWLKNITNETNE